MPSSRIPGQPRPVATQELVQRSAAPRRVRHRRPGPTAVGRWLFAPEIRDAAYALQDNTVALRLAALWTASSALLYLCGLLLSASLSGSPTRHGRRAAMLHSSAGA